MVKGARIDTLCGLLQGPPAVLHSSHLSSPAALACFRPDLAQKIVLDPDTGEERRINLGEDYRGRKVDPGRDVWVLQVTDDMGKVKHAGAEADGLLRLLRLRLANLRRELGDDAEITLDCMDELGTRLLGRALHEEAEQLYKECLRGRRSLSPTSVPHRFFGGT